MNQVLPIGLARRKPTTHLAKFIGRTGVKQAGRP